MWNDITCDDLTNDDLNPERENAIMMCIGIDDIMCDDITCEDLHLASVAGIVAITCDDLTYDDLNPECEITGLRMMI